MNYAALKKFDIANGPGVRVSLFVSGCRHRCKNCFNKEAWDFSYGKPFTESTEQEILTALSADYITGLSLLGGEPFEPENKSVLAEFLKKVKEKFPEKTIWCYTGFEFEKLNDGISLKMLKYIDVLVDGRFIEEIGTFDPMAGDDQIKIDAEAAQKWISNGAQPTETVKELLKKSGVIK